MHKNLVLLGILLLMTLSLLSEYGSYFKIPEELQELPDGVERQLLYRSETNKQYINYQAVDPPLLLVYSDIKELQFTIDNYDIKTIALDGCYIMTPATSSTRLGVYKDGCGESDFWIENELENEHTYKLTLETDDPIGMKIIRGVIALVA